MDLINILIKSYHYLQMDLIIQREYNIIISENRETK